MKLIKPKFRLVCECGVCRKKSDVTVVYDKVGLGRALNMCKDCATNLKILLNQYYSLDNTDIQNKLDNKTDNSQGVACEKKQCDNTIKTNHSKKRKTR